MFGLQKITYTYKSSGLRYVYAGVASSYRIWFLQNRGRFKKHWGTQL